MLKQAAILTAAAMALSAGPVTAGDRPTGEEKLAKLIEGRTAGEPKSCIAMFGNRNLTVIDKTAIVYKDGSRVWVNRTANPESIDDSDVLVIRKHGSGSSLCRTDMVTTADRTTGMFSGIVSLVDFVPYEKTDG
ncbi:hypothetical protein [Qipengyuania sp.]|uniref:hypothetical protein n=1 Tax=Qipengyuania sp. TaxID=2004515 RepID=UPI0035C79A18